MTTTGTSTLSTRWNAESARPRSSSGCWPRGSAASMYDAVRTIRSAGLRTGLLSNSWGMADYPRHLFPGMFDVVVISAEVGMRKPEERIFLHATGLLGLDPAECVFVDDIQVNVAAAEAVGMTAILHTEPAATLTRLGGLLGLPLTG